MTTYVVSEQRFPRAVKGTDDYAANFKEIGRIMAPSPEEALAAYKAKRSLCLYPLAVEPIGIPGAPL